MISPKNVSHGGTEITDLPARASLLDSAPPYEPPLPHSVHSVNSVKIPLPT